MGARGPLRRKERNRLRREWGGGQEKVPRETERETDTPTDSG